MGKFIVEITTPYQFYRVEKIVGKKPKLRGTCRNVYGSVRDEEVCTWDDCENGFRCSECGEVVEDYEGYKVKGTWNYCPGCGREVER